MGMTHDFEVAIEEGATMVRIGTGIFRKAAVKLKVRVIPNAKKSEFSGCRDGEWVLRLNAPPVDGKANKAAVEFIAKSLGISRSGVCLIIGRKG